MKRWTKKEQTTCVDWSPVVSKWLYSLELFCFFSLFFSHADFVCCQRFRFFSLPCVLFFCFCIFLFVFVCLFVFVFVFFFF